MTVRNRYCYIYLWLVGNDSAYHTQDHNHVEHETKYKCECRHFVPEFKINRAIINLK